VCGYLQIVTHGVTDFSANFTYSQESGALDEAFCDCMAATVERLVQKKDPKDVWTIGEDIDLRADGGVGVRNMANASSAAQYAFDHYYGKCLVFPFWDSSQWSTG
jgi:Zn-dependent metalloprotease